MTFTVNGKPSHSYPRRPELGDSVSLPTTFLPHSINANWW
ncbi:hypothetical protein [Rubritalea tangerina]